MKAQVKRHISAAYIVKSGWDNKIGTPDTFVNLFSYSKYIMKWVKHNN